MELWTGLEMGLEMGLQVLGNQQSAQFATGAFR